MKSRGYWTSWEASAVNAALWFAALLMNITSLVVVLKNPEHGDVRFMVVASIPSAVLSVTYSVIAVGKYLDNE